MNLKVSIAERRGDHDFDIDLELPVSGVTALFGPSGAGKTTILRVIAGLEKLESASVRYGRRLWQQSDVFVETYKRRVGFVFQEPSLFSHLTAIENIEYAMQRAHLAGPSQIAEAIEILDLAALLERYPSELSGGEQRRVAIARALASHPSLLLFDEPLSGLDQARRHEILPFLERLRSHLNIPMVYVSHDLDEVARIADTVALIDAGKIVGIGTLSQMLTTLEYPLAHREDAESVITAHLSKYDVENKVNHLQFSGGELRVVGPALPAAVPIRLRIAARDVSVTLGKQTDTSILNVLPAEILEIKEAQSAQNVIALKLGDAIILSRITRLSAQNLNLKVGRFVYVQVKSVAVLGSG